MNTEFFLFQGSVARCDVANERPSKTSDPDFSLTRKIYVGDLAAGVTSENLHSDFQMHGEIEEAVVMTKYSTMFQLDI